MDKLNDLRKVANINNLNWELLEQPGLPDENVWWFNLSYDPKSGQGSYPVSYTHLTLPTKLTV